MTDKKDPHAELMRLADRFATTKPGGLAVARRDALDAYARTLTDRITELEAQLEAVGAGGVGVMMPAKKEPTVPDNMQDWAGMDGAIAWHLIERHADNWADIGKMMGEWLAANRGAQPAPAVVGSVALVSTLLLEAEKFWWNDGPEGKTADDMNAAKDAVLRALAAPQLHQIAEPAGNATPSVKGIYAWVPENGPPALLHVNKRPSSHSPGGVLNAHVLQSPSFYDGCAVSQWGPGCWILLRNLEIKKEPS